jgi:hypothetical protein
MFKTTAYVMLISLVVGILLEILFPEILLFEFKNNVNNLPNISEFKGSVYAVGFWFPVLISAIAGFLSETYIRFSKNYRRK